jgi:hypothetical protein
MNKCETPEMLEDYRKLIEADGQPAPLYAIARDDAAYEPPPESNLAAFRAAIASLARLEPARRMAGARQRAVDLLGRLRDQITAPLRSQRSDVEAAVAALTALETPPPGVDVNPLTEQLERRLQQRSVLYLIGPGRVLDRVRQMPAMLVRLPRAAWDFVLHGKADFPPDPGQTARQTSPLPDFSAALTDQFTIIQSRIEDVLRSTPACRKWTDDPAQGYAACKFDPAAAGKIADEELHATPSCS